MFKVAYAGSLFCMQEATSYTFCVKGDALFLMARKRYGSKQSRCLPFAILRFVAKRRTAVQVTNCIITASPLCKNDSTDVAIFLARGSRTGWSNA